MPQRGPSASQEHTLPQPMGPVPMPQRGPSASQEHTLPQGVTPSQAPTEGPRGPRVSPMHLAVGLGVVAAGVAGFALVFWIAGRAPADAAALAAPAAASAPAPAATPAAAAPPSEVAASSSPALPTPRASAPAAETASSAPRLPFVDPGPMPEEHAGSDAIVDRFRESLSRGSRARSRGDLEGALQAYRFAVHLKPRSTDAVLGMARTYQDAEQLEDALRWAERARDVELRGIEGRLTVGDLLLSLGRHDQAIATWREAQARAPRDSSPGERIRRAEEALAEQD